MPHTGDYGQKGPGVVIALGALKKRRDNSDSDEGMPMEHEDMMAEFEARLSAVEDKVGIKREEQGEVQGEVKGEEDA